jgi:predicted transcriptional regulator
VDNLKQLSPAARKIYTRYLNAVPEDQVLKLQNSFENASIEETEEILMSDYMTQHIVHLEKQKKQKQRHKNEEWKNIGDDIIQRQERRKVKPRPRDKNPEPSLRDIYSNMGIYYMTDTRLTSGARTCLSIMCGVLGKNKGGKTKVTSLAKLLGVTRRTVQRYLQELRDEGVIITRKTKNEIGMITGLFVIFNPLVFKMPKKLKTLAKQVVTAKTHHAKKIVKDRLEMTRINIINSFKGEYAGVT